MKEELKKIISEYYEWLQERGIEHPSFESFLYWFL